MIVLRQLACHDFDSCADAVAIAFGSFKLESQPVILAGAVVDPDFRRRADSARHDVELSIAVEITHRRSTEPFGRLRGKASFRSERPEFESPQILEHSIVLVPRHIGPW